MSFVFSATFQEPNGRLGQQPAEEEEDDTEEAEGGVVEVEGDDQANAETQQPAQADAAGVQGGQSTAVADQADLGQKRVTCSRKFLSAKAVKKLA